MPKTSAAAFYTPSKNTIRSIISFTKNNSGNSSSRYNSRKQMRLKQPGGRKHANRTGSTHPSALPLPKIVSEPTPINIVSSQFIPSRHSWAAKMYAISSE